MEGPWGQMGAQLTTDKLPLAILVMRFNGHFPGEPGLAGVYDGSGGDNC